MGWALTVLLVLIGLSMFDLVGLGLILVIVF
jgi:hypothetical protein